MTITSNATNILDSALQAWASESHVRLYKVERFGVDDILEYKINWAACGDSSVEETEKFIEALKVAKNLASDLNKLHCHVVMTWGEQGPVIPEAMRDEKIKVRGEEIKKLYNLLVDGKWSFVVAWLMDQAI